MADCGDERHSGAEQLVRPARTAARWAVRHGLPAVYLSRSARRGDAVGRLMRDRALRERPYALYDELRARGPLTGSSLGLVTTSHPVAQEVLRSDRFGVGWDRSASADPLMIRSPDHQGSWLTVGGEPGPAQVSQDALPGQNAAGVALP